MLKFCFCTFELLTQKNIKLHFELLTQSQLILEIRFYFCRAPLEGHQEKTSPFFCSPTKWNYIYIIISYCSQSLFSRLDLLVIIKPGTQNQSFFIRMYKTLVIKLADGNSSKLVSQVKNCLLNQFQTWKCQGKNNDK